MASCNTGYEDERFQHIVSQTLHCCICTNVIKDAAMCHNEHIFCRACITRHLMNFQTCPTCMQPLTVETLRKAPRTVTNLLSELKIRCEFFNRGCGKFIELGDLERHVTECGFAPAVCSNEGCRLEVNKQDLLHHETAVCELRRVQCHSCHDIRKEMDTVKVNLAAMNEKLDCLDRNEKDFGRFEENLKSNVKAVEKNVVGKVELVQEQLNKQEESNRQLKADLEADNVEMKKSLNEIMKQLERMTQQTSHEVQTEEMKKGIAEADGIDREPKIVVAGGKNGSARLNSVEMFSLSNGTWTPLQPMREYREGAFSVVHNNHIFVSGGYVKSIERLSLIAVQTDQSTTWENLSAELPVPLEKHCSVVYNGHLIVIGGVDNIFASPSRNRITEISLVPPYISKLLATMPQGRSYHGVALFGDKIVIVGGSLNGGTVLEYDITENAFRRMTSLPYHVYGMAMIKWNDNFILLGGWGKKGRPLSKVLMYNIQSEKSYMLPEMLYKRTGCVAAVVKDTIIVMGGYDEGQNYLKSAESFRFDRFTWKELPEMHEERYKATAVVC